MPLMVAMAFVAAAAAPTPEEARRSARTALDQARFADAERIISDALARFGSRDSETVWDLRVMLGELVMSTQGLHAAEEKLRFALPVKYEHSETAVRLAIMRALAAPDKFSMQPAHDLAAKYHPPMLADVYLYMSSLKLMQPNVTALELSTRAARLARENGRPGVEAKALTNVTMGLMRSGRYEEAVDIGERAVSLTEKERLSKTVATAKGNLGSAYFELGDYENAERLFLDAPKTGARRDLPVWLIQLGNIEFQKRNWAAAIEYNTQAAALAQDVGRSDQLGYAYDNIATSLLELGRVDEAEQFNEKALTAKKGDAEATLRSRVVRARIAALRGDHAGAETIFEEALRQKPGASVLIDAETYFAQLLARQNRVAEARSHFERAARAAHLGRMEIKNEDLRFAFLNTAAYMFDEYVDFLVRIRDVEGALAVTESSRAQSLEEGLNLDKKIDARAIARSNNATILSYWLGRRRSLVWVITPSQVTVYPLPPDTKIEAAATKYREQLLGGRGTPERSVTAATELYKMLVPAGNAFAKNQRVMVIPDGQLNTLNFETLMPRDGSYWIEDVVLREAPSLQLIARGARTAAIPKSLLLVGDAPAVASFPKLKHASLEMDKVASKFVNPKFLRGKDATPRNYQLAAGGKFDVQHFVAHGTASSLRPLDSAIILAAPDANSSYRLLARDIMKQPLDARLVTISSCHGVGTRTYAGEGVVGLAWAFLKAGADQVIAALWEVNDSATPQLMETMYGEIRKGRDPADALREAKLRLIRGNDAHRKPLYWAPFVLYAGT